MSHDHALDPMAVQESDYVQCFEQLASVEVEIRRRGPSPHLLLRRAILHLAIGNVVPALRAAQEAVARAPRDGEAHYQEGLAWLTLARVQCGAVTAPGVAIPAHRPLISLVENAYEALCSAANCCPEDAEARLLTKEVEGLLMLDDDALAQAL